MLQEVEFFSKNDKSSSEDQFAWHLPAIPLRSWPHLLSDTRYRPTNPSSSLTPRPGRSGTSMKPFTDCIFSTVNSCGNGESSTQSSNTNASRHVESQWMLAAT